MKKQGRTLSLSKMYGTMERTTKASTRRTRDECDDYDYDDSDGDDDWIKLDESLRQHLLARVHTFTLPHDPHQGYRATQLCLVSFERPHMRTFHASWICFMMAWLVWFSMAPLLPHIEESIPGITIQDIWMSNMWSMVGTIFLRILLGPLCDQYGARGMLTGLLAFCSVPLGLSGLLIQNSWTLFLVRFWIGCVGGTLVPAQYWITSHFVREVCGMAMAIGAGWGAMGGGLAQVIIGSIIFPWLKGLLKGDSNMAWRLSLVVPSVIALAVAIFFHRYSDDCPLGNYHQVQRAGLMQERSAIDSFRSGMLNLNAWILFFQYVLFGFHRLFKKGMAVTSYHRN